MKKTLPTFAIISLMVASLAFAQPCNQEGAQVFQPYYSEGNGISVFSKFVGMIEFEDESNYPKFYRRITYSGGWGVSQSRATHNCEASFAGGALAVTFSGSDAYGFSGAVASNSGRAVLTGRSGSSYSTSFATSFPPRTTVYPGSGLTGPYLQVLGLSLQTPTKRTYSLLPPVSCSNGGVNTYQVGRMNNGSDRLYGRVFQDRSVSITLSEEDTIKDATNHAVSRGGIIDNNYNGNTASARRELSSARNFVANGRWFEAKTVDKTFHFKVFDIANPLAYQDGSCQGAETDFELNLMTSADGMRRLRFSISEDGLLSGETSGGVVQSVSFDPLKGDILVRVEIVVEVGSNTLESISIRKIPKSECDIELGESAATIGSIDWKMQLGKMGGARADSFGLLRYYFPNRRSLRDGFDYAALQLESNVVNGPQSVSYSGENPHVRRSYLNSSGDMLPFEWIYVAKDDDIDVGYTRQIKVADGVVDIQNVLYDFFPLYDSEAVYSNGDRVIFDDAVYQSLHDTNAVVPIANGLVNTVSWWKLSDAGVRALTGSAEDLLRINIYYTDAPEWDEVNYLYEVEGTPDISYLIDDPDPNVGTYSTRIRKFEEGGSEPTESLTYNFLDLYDVELIREDGLRVERKTNNALGYKYEIGSQIGNDFSVEESYTVDQFGSRSYDGAVAVLNQSLAGRVMRTYFTSGESQEIHSWLCTDYLPAEADFQVNRPWLNSSFDLANPSASEDQHDTEWGELNVVDTSNADGDGVSDRYTRRIREIEGNELYREYDVDFSQVTTIDDATQIVDGVEVEMSSAVRSLPGQEWTAATSRETVRYQLTSDADERYANLPVATINLSDGTATLYQYPIPLSGHHVELRYTGRLSGGEAWDRNAIPQPSDFVSGSMTRTEWNYSDEVISVTETDIQTAVVTYSRVATAFEASDVEGRPTRYDYLDGTYETMSYACCGIDVQQDQSGNLTDYDYDALGRVEYITYYQGSSNQQVMYYKRNAVGDILETWVGPDSDNLVRSSSQQYDLAGELTRTSEWFLDHEAGESGAASSFRYQVLSDPSVDQEGFVVQEVTSMNGFDVVATVIERRYKDGRLYERSGSAENGGVRYEYAVENDPDLGYYAQTTKEIPLDQNGAPRSEYTKTYTDAFGRVYKVERPSAAPSGGPVAQSTYYEGSSNEVVKTIGFDGEITLFDTGFSSSIGEYSIQALDVDGDEVIDLNGAEGKDRVTRRSTMVTTRTVDDVSYTVLRESVELWSEDGADTSETVATRDRALTSQKTWSNSYGQGLSTTVSTDPLTQTVTVVEESSLGRRSVSQYLNDLLVALDVYELDSETPSLLSSESYTYDSLRRREVLTDNLRATTTTLSYFLDGRYQTVLEPAPDTDSSDGTPSAQLTETHYLWPYTYKGAAGLLTATYLPDGTARKNFSLESGETLLEAASTKQHTDLTELLSVTTRDYLGRVNRLTTYQDALTGAGATQTIWQYNAAGLLQQKWYDATASEGGAISGTLGNVYSYTPAGRLQTHQNARGDVATYGYNSNYTDLNSITYDDGLTAAVYFTEYDRLGRPTEIQDASGTRRVDYEQGRLMDENYTAGMLNGYKIERRLDGENRIDQLKLVESETIDHYQVNYDYDGASRLEAVRFAGNRVSYAYDAASELRQTQTFNNGLSDVLTVEQRRDNLNRLKSIQAKNAASVVLSSHTYLYDHLHRRTRATTADGNYWSYGYDSLGQVNSAVRRNASDAELPGYNWGYTFDDVGNRTETTTNARTTSYQPNQLNQYNARSAPRALDVRGSAVAAATVTVNGQSTLRDGAHFYRELDLSAAGEGAQQVDLSITATLPDGGDGNAPRIADAEKSAYLAASPEAYLYDADGNLTQDGRWHYTWDAENRLIEMETVSAAYNAGAPRQKLAFAYDGQGRRFSKELYDWDSGSGSYSLSSSYLYLYDAWNLIAEFKSTQASPFTLHNGYTWGLDLSGSLQGAGGVGGLLAMTDAAGSTFFPTYDGNGNVMSYYAADNGASVAEFEYGPFGELIRATGSKKDDFNFRFSTKYEDAETGLLYYGFRYYDAEVGRWLSRDPIEEEGGLNLYGFVLNSPLNFIDYLGWDPVSSFGNGSKIYRPGQEPDGFSGVNELTAEQSKQLRDAKRNQRRLEDAQTRRLRKEFADQAKDFDPNTRSKPCLDDDELLVRRSFLQEEFGLTNEEYLLEVAKYAGNEAVAQVAMYAAGGAVVFVKSTSPVWKKFKPHKGITKTNGLKGGKKRYYEWDHTHGDIEVYDRRGNHLGSADPKTGEIYKPAVPGRKIQL